MAETSATAPGPRKAGMPWNGLSSLGIVVWTLLVGLSLAVNLHERSTQAERHARIVANAYIDKDLAVRSWITGHGGVYVRPTEHSPPNEWLDVPERDVVTTTGKALTLVNPAYATRQLMEAFAAQTGIRGHLTSLKLKNPNNAPDAWEEGALKRLAHGDKEVAEVVARDGVPVLRVMRPVYMERGCLKCHEDLKIPVGGLRGGIGADVPLPPFFAAQEDAKRKLAATHGLIWFVGVGALGIVHLRGSERRRERKRAETGLRERERLLREAQEVARMGSWSLDHATGELVWSDSMYGIFGVEAKTFRPSRNAMLALIHADDRAAETRRLDAALAERRDYEAVLRLRRDDGGIRFVKMRGQTQYAPDGTAQRTVGTAQDVTEHRELELLRRSEANLSALFENTDRLIWSVDAQMRLVVSNSLFDDMVAAQIGRPPLPGEPMPPPELPQAEADAWRSRYARALGGETFSIEAQTQGARGADARWIAFSFYPIADDGGHVVGITVFGQDFTERRQAELQRQEALDKMARMVDELESHHKKTMQINRLNDLLQSCRNEAEAREVIRLSLADIFAGSTGGLALTTRRGAEIERIASWGGEPNVIDTFLLDDCWALRRGEVHEVRDVGGLVCSHFEQAPAHGYVCLPLVVKGETLGVLHLAFPAPCDDACMTETRDFAHAAVETIKLSLSNLRLREALHEQATHDALTGLFNRRYLDETLPRELHRIHRSGGRLTVAMLDIDHFKRFNDSMGHEAGDTVLRAIGRILRDNLRKSDLGCRYGGEELVLIMPDSGAEDAEARIQHICELIRSMQVEFHGEPLPRLTMSAGIAEAFRHGDDAAAVLRTADAALYTAKAAGRDRVVVFAPPAI